MKKDKTIGGGHGIAKRKLELHREKIVVLSTKDLHLAGGWAAMSGEEEGSCNDICSK